MAVEAVHAAVPVERPWIPRVAGVVCITIGVLDVAAAVSPGLWRRVHLLTDVLPGAISQATVAALLAVGIGFMLLGGGLARRKRRAWQLAVVLLAASVGLHLFGPAPAHRAGRGVVGDARSAGRVPARVLRGRRPVHAVVGAALPARPDPAVVRRRAPGRVRVPRPVHAPGRLLVDAAVRRRRPGRGADAAGPAAGLPAGRRVLLAARPSAWSRWGRRCSCCCARRGRSRCSPPTTRPACATCSCGTASATRSATSPCAATRAWSGHRAASPAWRTG